MSTLTKISKSKKQTANPASINWAARVAKRRNDEFLNICLGPLLNSKTEFDILSLPASEWLWERHISEAWSTKFFRFQGVERDPGVWESAAAKAKHLNAEYGVNALYELLPDPSFKAALVDATTPFDIIYADYMGAWSLDKLDDTGLIFSKGLLNPFGCLIVTLSLVRNASPLFREIQEYAQGLYEFAVIDDREHCRSMGFLPRSSVTEMSRGIPRMIMDQAGEAGVRLKLVMGHVYYNAYEHQGSTRLAPEISLCFRRELK